MTILDRCRERITGGVGWLIVSVREMRLDAVREQAVALWAARGRFRGSNAILIAATAAVLTGIVVLSVRDAASRTGERDFDLPVVCAECGREFSLSREEVFDAIAAARQKGLATAGQDPQSPLGPCPKCGKLALYRVRDCPNCRKRLPLSAATGNGGRVPPKCPNCGWSAKRPGG